MDMVGHEVEMNEVVSTSEIGKVVPKVVPFATMFEDWSYYKTDGYVVAIKTIPTKMYDMGKKSIDGVPQFVVSATNAVITMTDEEYRARTKLLSGV